VTPDPFTSVASVLALVCLRFHDPWGDRLPLLIYGTILDSFWLPFAFPIDTVGSSVHSRTRRRTVANSVNRPRRRDLRGGLCLLLLLRHPGPLGRETG
jgi:hypothetical protein